MGIADAIVQWLLKGIRIPKTALVELADRADADEDGYIDLGEFIALIKAWRDARWQRERPPSPYA